LEQQRQEVAAHGGGTGVVTWEGEVEEFLRGRHAASPSLLLLWHGQIHGALHVLHWAGFRSMDTGRSMVTCLPVTPRRVVPLPVISAAEHASWLSCRQCVPVPVGSVRQDHVDLAVQDVDEDGEPLPFRDQSLRGTLDAEVLR